MKGPNPLSVGISVVRALGVPRPHPSASPTDAPDHSALVAVLEAVERRGIAGLPDLLTHIDAYVAGLAEFDPDKLGKPDALAYWLNLYNAGALRLAGQAFLQREESVLRLPGAFTSSLSTIGGQALTLTQIEHGKLRRLGDPRIHGALVCGSASCPTLRFEPYVGSDLDAQLDDQMKRFLADGGAQLSGDKLLLSRIFLWYGADFVRPHRMPAMLPARKIKVAMALKPWLAPGLAVRLGEIPIAFQSYDWSLACSIR